MTFRQLTTLAALLLAACVVGTQEKPVET